MSREIFTVGKDYVIAMLTEIDDNDYASLEKVASRSVPGAARQKYDYIVKDLAGSTLAEQASSLGSEVDDFSGVTFGSFYIDGIGMGPVWSARSPLRSRVRCRLPWKGLSGVYVFEVEDVQTEEKQTAEVKRSVPRRWPRYGQQFAYPAIQQMAKIQDLRGSTSDTRFNATGGEGFSSSSPFLSPVSPLLPGFFVAFRFSLSLSGSRKLLPQVQ